MLLFEDMEQSGSLGSDDAVTDKILYLTFDDGPSDNTRMILDTLKKYNAKASFFLIGRKGFAHVREILQEGHALGIHSYSHKKELCYLSEDAFMQELEQFQQELAQYTDYVPGIIRFPFGSINTVNKDDPGMMRRLCRRVQDAGYRYFDFDVIARDTFDNRTPETVLDAVIRGICKASKKHTMIVLHETQEHSARAVEQILLWGIQNGYTFLPITEATPPCCLDPETYQKQLAL